jgi:hypothetical protein
MAIWQGSGDHHADHVDTEGSRDEVIRWARTCEPAAVLQFDPTVDDYLPVSLDHLA